MTKLLRCVLLQCVLLTVASLESWAGQAPDFRKEGFDWDEYDPSLFYRLQSVSDILDVADSSLGAGSRRSRAYSELLTSLIRKRFYHAYSFYSVQDNWVAWLAGVLIWDHLHAILLPDDMLKYPMAACSQQAIVLKECFRRIGVDYREIGLNGHFVLEGKVEGQWLFFDPNLEPRFINGRKSLEELIRNGELYAAYKEQLSHRRIDIVFAQPVYRAVNAPIAPNGTFFQQVTWILSLALPLVLPLGLLLYLLTGMRRRNAEEPGGVKFVEIRAKVEKETAD